MNLVVGFLDAQEKGRARGCRRVFAFASRDARIQDGHLVPELDVEDEEGETRTL
ncbi:hypothetical protein ACW9YV_20570 (plasmid) [Paraburkholderia strydomiana]